jgi:molybdate transport system ATP-binding protein
MSFSVDIRKTFGTFTLDVEWSIENDLAVLFGCSGAGKSLTLQMIAGLIRPDEGSISFNNRTLFHSATRVNVAPQERSFGYVFQDLALFPHMTVLENILYGAHGVDKDERMQRAAEMIDRFQLAGQERKLPGRISGGQKQRVALARALIRRPAALLLDEPFSALDASLRMEMQQLLKELRREFRIPIVLVTHDLAEASLLADKLIIYANGTVMQAGSPAVVLAAPACTEVALLVGTRNRPRRTACVLPAVRPSF